MRNDSRSHRKTLRTEGTEVYYENIMKTRLCTYLLGKTSFHNTLKKVSSTQKSTLFTRKQNVLRSEKTTDLGVFRDYLGFTSFPEDFNDNDQLFKLSPYSMDTFIHNFSIEQVFLR